ncbi:engulfment and cell motility ELM family protein [Tieghemostelium lacteum]|uniref:Engulfment and cell motility ELM family protein n=1 Tax=Tieghemostelium lacteum TaxID=361077 RepID=A0A151Z5A4_TIELA|nr:engulfment and cell motility ELM family protein [Tieghemostelium lacteum]|eukprot:KYQ89159.1 engulfment and cell motility ELM family protein [Tieghemostelium lacteum]
MKIQIYNNSGEEFSYDFKSDISFSSHIKNLYENLVLHSDQIKKLLTSQWGGDVDISSHYSIQESQSAQWIESSNDSLISQENTLYFKLKPLNVYIQTVEKYLNIVSSNSSATPSSPAPKAFIENQIHSTVQNTQSTQLLNNAIDRLHVHITLLMYEDKNNLYFSSSVIKRLINIVFLAPSINSLNLLVFFLSHSNNNNQNNVNEYSSTSTQAIKKNTGDSVLPIPQPKSPRSNNNNNSKPKLSETTTGSYLLSGNQQNESISLFTLVETSIRELSKEHNKNFYLHLLDEHPQAQSQPLVLLAQSTQMPISTSCKIEVLKVINNMYRLSPNPVVYATRLHQEGVFKRIITLRERDLKLFQHPQYQVLRGNLMKELHHQRLQQINPDKLQHQILLVDLWNSAIPNTPYGGTHSSHWLSLGFRGPNPIEDFKVTGILALRNLAYFAKHYLKPFQHILMTQTKREDLSSKSSLIISNGEPISDSNDSTTQPTNEDNNNNSNNNNGKSRSYPLAAACISLTYTLSNIFRIGRETTPDATLWDIAFCDPNWFDECFVTTVHLFESLWHSEAHSYSDFPQVISHSRQIIEKVCSDLPKSVQEFKDKLDGILEKKIPLDFEVSNELMARYHQLQPSNTTKRHIHKIFGERIDVDIVQPQDTTDGVLKTSPSQEEELEQGSTTKPKRSSSLKIDIPNSNNNMSNEIGDGPISPTNFSYKRLIKFFGERVNSRSVQFAPQPSNVKSYKLKNFFGESAVILNQNDQSKDDTNNGTQEVSNGQPVEEEEEDEDVHLPMTERSHRLHVFFGEWFDTEQVEYNEKIRFSTSPEQTPPTSPTLGHQPEHTRLHKLNKFFGERVNIPISKSKIVGEGGGGGIFPMDDMDDSNASAPQLHHYNSTENQARSPEEARSDFKAQKLLGERLDIKKEKESLQFAPQPSHIREYKLHKLFGEMIPSSKTQQKGGSTGSSSGPWKKGSIKVSNSNASTIMSSKSTFYQQPIVTGSVTAPTSPRDNDLYNISLKSTDQQISSISVPVSPTTVYPVSQSLPTSPRLSSGELVSPKSSSPHQLLMPQTLTDTFGVLKDASLDTNLPNSIRSSTHSDSHQSTCTTTTTNTTVGIEQFVSTLTTQFGEDDEEDEEEEDEEESPKIKTLRSPTNKGGKEIGKKRLQVFFGERFDVEDAGYHSRLSGTFSNSPPTTSTSLPIQPETVKFFKLKKFFGKSPDTETDSLNSSGDSHFKKSISEDDDLLVDPDNVDSVRGSGGSIKKTIANLNTHTLSSSLTSPRKNSNKLRRDFKPQKILGERIDIQKEKDYSSFKDQPSTVKVDKLIGLFGEKVSFNLKRRDSSPTLMSTKSKSMFNLKEPLVSSLSSSSSSNNNSNISK